jgi:DNA-binding helix-hairpin-helix protein with protein kinase domain
MADLRKAYDRHCGLERERQTEMQRLEHDKRQVQLDNFLRGELLSRAKIPGIGNARRQRLLSFGIGSAFDVRRNLNISGFGPTNMSHLWNWRIQCEARFRYQPLLPIPPTEIQRVNLRIAAIRSDLEATLRNGHTALVNLSAATQARHLQLTGQLQIAAARRAQAQADCQIG